MKVIVDTCIWSEALRRENKRHSKSVDQFRFLIIDNRVQLIGPIRQELLSGIRQTNQFKQLKKHLDGFNDLPILTEDYILAAEYFHICRSKGIQGSNTDFQICAVASRTQFPIYTSDNDFELFAKYISISLFKME
ncbi:PIN domain-containing protein [bacterium]|nr:PIN domain-containing protein [bacterium]